MSKLYLQKAKEPEIKLSTSIGSSKKQDKNIYFCFIDYVKAFDCGSQQTVENSSRDGNTRPPYLSSEKSVWRSRSNMDMDIRTGHGTTDCFQIGKGVRQGCILSPCLFNFYAEYIMRNAGLEEAQVEIKIARRHINNLRFVTFLLLCGLQSFCPLMEKHQFSSVHFSSVAQSCLTLCDPMNCSTPGLPVHHQLPEFTQTHIHRVGDAIQPSHPLSSPSLPARSPSQYQSFPMSQLFA